MTEKPQVIDYLNKENTYYDAMTALKIFKRIVWGNEGRIKEDDQSVPYLYNGYYYITRFEKGRIILFILEKEVFLPMKKFYLTVMSWPKDIPTFN
jgi:protease II